MNRWIETLVTLQQWAPGLVLLWAAFLGGSIGSFLNVVVYRGPAKISLLYPPSRCPNCLHAIRWYDNLPVISWLWLHGKCRDCQQPISRRYPAVEFFVAIGFVAIWMTTLGFRTPPEFVLSQTREFLQRSAFFSVLLCHTLIAWDGARWPRWLAVWGCLVPVASSLTAPLFSQLALAMKMVVGGGVAGVMSYLSGTATVRSGNGRDTDRRRPLPTAPQQSPWLWAGVGAMCVANTGLVPSTIIICVALPLSRWVKVSGNRPADFRAMLLLALLAAGDVVFQSSISN